MKTREATILSTTDCELVSELQARHIDLIVMRSHGYTGLKRWMLGSVAEKFARHAAVPLLILREERSLPLTPDTRVGRSIRALVPLDSSLPATAALTPAARLVAALSTPARGALCLAQVVVPPDVLESCQRECDALVQKAQSFLEGTVERMRHDLIAPLGAELNLSLTWSVTLDDDIPAGICRLAEDGADVIVMATHEFYGLQQWAIGSITERVLHTTRLPLLVVRH